MATQDLAKAIQLILDPPGMYENPPRGWNSAERAILKSVAGSFNMSSDQFKSAVLAREITTSTAPTTTGGATSGSASTPTTTTPSTTTGGTTTLSASDALMKELAASGGDLAKIMAIYGYTPSGTTTGTAPTAQQQADYKFYLELLQTATGSRLPTPKDIADYLANEDKWMAQYTELIRAYETYKKYASRYGTPDDWYALNIEDFYKNYSQAQAQLTTWLSEHGVSEAEREEYEAGREEYEEYALSPEEQARRREEAYAASQYAQEEAYREQPMYSETFTKWIEGQGGVSQALKSYIEREYPSLQSEYEAGVGRLTGYPTREEARAEAQRRETGWSAWLTEKTPEITQDYYMQRPTDRGERMWMQAPMLREVSW